MKSWSGFGCFCDEEPRWFRGDTDRGKDFYEIDDDFECNKKFDGSFVVISENDEAFEGEKFESS